MRTIARRLRAAGQSIGLVPTLGGLHEGHLALVHRSREQADITIVSIVADVSGIIDESGQRARRRVFTQDVELLVPTGVEYVFAPSAKHLLPADDGTEVVMKGLGGRLFDSLQPGRYNSFATMLSILLNVVGPDFICLAQKDPQLIAVADRLIEDLQFAVQMVSIPIVREPDGVAASWWLSQMTPGERQATTAFHLALEKAQVLFGAGERDTANLTRAMREVLEAEPLVRVEYLGVVSTRELEPLAIIDEEPVMAVVAGTIGKARLMDNVVLNE
jgi:pantoate--beta-alanine ligase